MKKSLFLTLGLTALLCSVKAQETVAHAQAIPLKIGYTNVEYMLGLLPETKKIESECKSFEKQLRNQFEAQLGEYQQKAQAFEQGYATMTEAVRNQKQKELQQLREDLDQLQLEAQEKLVNKRNSLFMPIYDKITSTIEQVAKENGYTHVFNANTGGIPVLLYVSEEHNISALVLKKLGVSPDEHKKKSCCANKKKSCPCEK